MATHKLIIVIIAKEAAADKWTLADSKTTLVFISMVVVPIVVSCNLISVGVVVVVIAVNLRCFSDGINLAFVKGCEN